MNLYLLIGNDYKEICISIIPHTAIVNSQYVYISILWEMVKYRLRIIYFDSVAYLDDPFIGQPHPLKFDNDGIQYLLATCPFLLPTYLDNMSI